MAVDGNTSESWLSGSVVKEGCASCKPLGLSCATLFNGSIIKAKEERPNPLAASPMDSSGEVVQDEYNDQLKQIILVSSHLQRF